MDWVELHNVEFGDCTVLGGNGQMLMVDCGSLNSILGKGACKFEEYAKRLTKRYAPIEQRHGMISHFHKDHVNGFSSILQEEPLFFQRIYLPPAPQDSNGNPLLLEFALLVYTFITEKSDYSELVDNIVTAFSRMRSLSSTQSLAVLCQGDQFQLDDITYEVLWPKQTEYPYSESFYEVVEQANRLLTTTWGNHAELFLNYKDAFCDCYLRCVDLLSLHSSAALGEKNEAISQLEAILHGIDEIIYELNSLPVAQDVAELVGSQKARMRFGKELNGSSIVFHNQKQNRWFQNKHTREDILFTGDATPNTMEKISEMLHDRYYLVKAPHHGTSSEWWEGWNTIEITHMLISNGHHSAGGMIGEEYVLLPAIKHCTNCTRCRWYVEKGKCCNRKKKCKENEHPSHKVKKCPANQPQQTDDMRGCNIYTVSPLGTYACNCKEQPRLE